MEADYFVESGFFLKQNTPVVLYESRPSCMNFSVWTSGETSLKRKAIKHTGWTNSLWLCWSVTVAEGGETPKHHHVISSPQRERNYISSRTNTERRKDRAAGETSFHIHLAAEKYGEKEVDKGQKTQGITDGGTISGLELSPLFPWGLKVTFHLVPLPQASSKPFCKTGQLKVHIYSTLPTLLWCSMVSPTTSFSLFVCSAAVHSYKRLCSRSKQ